MPQRQLAQILRPFTRTTEAGTLLRANSRAVSHHE